MTLMDLLTKIDEEQQLSLCNEKRQLKITGDAASICAMTVKNLLLSKVDKLGVMDNAMWIWIKEAEEDD